MIELGQAHDTHRGLVRHVTAAACRIIQLERCELGHTRQADKGTPKAVNITAAASRATQAQVLRTLSITQVFSGLGNGSTLALGSILAMDLSGSEAWAGLVNTALTLGTAATAIPLSQLAVARGRRIALITALVAAIAGTGLMVTAVLTRLFVVLTSELLDSVHEVGQGRGVLPVGVQVPRFEPPSPRPPWTGL